MKTIFKIVAMSLLVLSVFLITHACEKKKDFNSIVIDNTHKEEPLKVYFIQEYALDTVVIELDGQMMFSDVITKTKMIGYTRMVILNPSIGTHEISISVNKLKLTESFEHKKDLNIAIYHHPEQSKINLIYTTDELIFD